MLSTGGKLSGYHSGHFPAPLRQPHSDPLTTWHTRVGRYHDRVARQEELADRVIARFGQSETELIGLLGEEVVRDLHENAASVPELGVGPDGAAMIQIEQYLQAHLNDVVALRIMQIGDEADQAGDGSGKAGDPVDTIPFGLGRARFRARNPAEADREPLRGRDGRRRSEHVLHRHAAVHVVVFR